ncbi:MAG: hypothetical protein B6U76_08410 [Desulfurococcales archaeon ex4484_217_2]|nr:MAG: hypothetical protein B6U76_08410 [Desulfurococcales archaeon ex4484_217_2]
MGNEENIVIEELKNSELKEFRELVKEVFNNYDTTYVLKALGHVRTYVAKYTGKIVGFAETYMTRINNTKAGVIYYIGVHPKFRKKGVGKALVNYAIDYFRKHGAKIVLASTRTWNIEARKFFKNLGFEEIPYERVIEEKGYEHFLKLLRALYAYEDDIFLIKKL